MNGFRPGTIKPKRRNMLWALGVVVPVVATSLAPDTALAGDLETAVVGDTKMALVHDEFLLSAAPLPSDNLEEKRGGFALGLFDIDIGGEVRSVLGGVFELVSRFSVRERVGNRLLGTFHSVSGVSDPSVGSVTSVETPTGTTATIVPDTDPAASTTTAVADDVDTTGTTPTPNVPNPGGAEITHDFANGINAIISNTFNNATAEQQISLDAKIKNYQSIAKSFRGSRHNSSIADDVVRFLPSR